MRSLAALVATAAAVALASPAAAVRPAPALRLAHAQPLVLAGAHFAARERVTVTIHARQPHLRRVVTGADGSYTVSFGAVAAAPCVDHAARRSVLRAAPDLDQLSLVLPARVVVGHDHQPD
ncbi:MAG: hypothetical protein ACXVZ3_11855 [Gaiellaceae bacterium]